MSMEPLYRDKDNSRSTTLDEERKATAHPRHHDPVPLAPHNAGSQKPSARNTPMLSFQPHHTEISTHRPSVSGRLFLHIPKLAGKQFHFVSLALHLRLKESIAWTRQDLVTFKIEKRDWSQTVWDKKMVLPYQDRQVEEGSEPYVAVVKEPSKGKNRIEIAADEWRWEWLVPVTENEVRPESFEGSMGNVWYELEAKCLFRWDDVDKDGNVEAAKSSPQTLETTFDSMIGSGSNRHNGSALLKGLEGSSKKAKSLAQALGKLRVGTKSKKVQHAGDFKLGNQHEEYVKRSLRMRDNSLLQDSGHGDNSKAELRSAFARGQGLPLLGAAEPDVGHAAEPLPFLIRKILKLYFIKPPPNTPSHGAFFLPPPSMALPTLPGTRRLKALIPGARIQVQIQVPSLIPIRGYARTSRLMPDSKKGGLVLNKNSAQQVNHQQQQQQQQQQQHHHQYQYYRHHHSDDGWNVDSRYLDSFQVALTIRKVTQKEIDKSDLLKKRYQNSGVSSSVSPFASSSDNINSFLTAETAGVRNRMLSTSTSSPSLAFQYKASADDNTKSKEAAAFGHPQGVNGSKRTTWRREIRVRKVKCEFWQKESCRIPSDTSEGASRTIKHALGPAFTYSEKEQERERSRPSTQLSSYPYQTQCGPSQQTASVSWDANVAGRAPADQPARERKNSNVDMPPSSILKMSSSLSLQSSPLSSSPLRTSMVPYASSRQGSNTSLYTSPAIQTIAQSSMTSTVPHPNISQASRSFMLLIPVPLDSPQLRQTFTWPSSDTPSPLPTKYYDPIQQVTSRGLSNSGVGANYPTSQSSYQMAMAGTAADSAAANAPISSSGLSNPTDDAAADNTDDLRPMSAYHHRHYHHYDHYGQVPNAISTRSRIEVKHYLSFRLSIDMLEFEGELDQDEELDLEAYEEQQLQQLKNVQELSAYRSTPSVIKTPAARTDRGVSRNGTIDSINSGISVSAASTVSVSEGMPNVQSSLAFINSTAGILNMDTDLDDEKGASPRNYQGHHKRGAGHHSHRTSRSNSVSSDGLLAYPPQPLLSVAYDFGRRRGSGASQGTVDSCSSDIPASHGGESAGSAAGHLAGAIGAIKKKVSSSGLNTMVNMMTGKNLGGGGQSKPQQGFIHHGHASVLSEDAQSHQHHQSSAITVQKLKDFVIRVPITVVIQVDDLSSIGTTSKIDCEDSATHTGNTGSQDDSRDSDGDGTPGATTGSGGKCGVNASYGPDTTNNHQAQHQQDAPEGSSFSVHVTLAGKEGEDEDAEYVEGSFMADSHG
ncbi:hypothetical protein BC939DRAFT_503936 [Gamsiella multidivaricata]|uniref:uncharacterized protein n=1 Tax=Gamsiella multidivaricata TaxID=101098 RepID=UPI00221FC8D4|nr:uncharacterized protein BC939DRAFT_503936 [Gamsiella multidivaricata]KAG0368267.1 hypothetical protein BGZ54_002314 [Gamsiella multidivaricata]KAI7822153.1 hypothetical protein BC939DRAFT_503936 [Gamsiella multidivaricata]